VLRNRNRAFDASSVVQERLNSMWNDCTGNEDAQDTIAQTMKHIHALRVRYFNDLLQAQIERAQPRHDQTISNS
jgi:hypothetical protein